jgi:hypothetical protein
VVKNLLFDFLNPWSVGDGGRSADHRPISIVADPIRGSRSNIVVVRESVVAVVLA